MNVERIMKKCRTKVGYTNCFFVFVMICCENLRLFPVFHIIFFVLLISF